MKYQKGYMDGAFGGIVWALLIIGIFFGFVIFIGIPWLWRIAKPFIHSITG